MTDFVKCHACGWLHFAISAEDARAEVSATNEMLASARLHDVRRASFDAYLRCFRCGADTASFISAVESDAPSGVTIQACVVQR